MIRFFLGSLLLLTFAGCGNNTDPLTVIASNNQGVEPTLDADNLGALQIGYSPSAPYWTFSATVLAGGPVWSLADGMVTETGTTVINGTTVNYITFLHSGNLSSRIYGVTTLSAVPGDHVVRTQSIGFGGNPLYLQVLVNGNPVCPLGYTTHPSLFNILGICQ